MSKRRKNKSMMPALLIGGGVLAYFLLTKNNSTAAAPVDNSGGGEIVDDGTGTGTPVVQPPPITASTETVTNLQTAAAINDRAALLGMYGDAAMKAAIKKMNDAETITWYNYSVNYVMQGKKLYQYPNATGIFSDGGWDTTLYNQVLAIKAKYNIQN